jgi:hypothetical protein
LNARSTVTLWLYVTSWSTLLHCHVVLVNPKRLFMFSALYPRPLNVITMDSQPLDASCIMANDFIAKNEKVDEPRLSLRHEKEENGNGRPDRERGYRMLRIINSRGPPPPPLRNKKNCTHPYDWELWINAEHVFILTRLLRGTDTMRDRHGELPRLVLLAL